LGKRSLYVLLLFCAVAAGFALDRLLAKTSAAERRPLYYVDPMHPAYRSDKPGIAPDCGMKLVPVYAEDSRRSLFRDAASSGIVTVDPDTRHLVGIQLTTVEKSTGQSSVKVFGRVAADQTRIYHVNLGTDGYVRETLDDAVDTYVKKNQHLAVVYSPDFLSLAGGYLSASERSSGGSGKENAAAAQQGAASSQARADRLRNLGMSDSQIDELSTTRKIPEDIYVVAPTDGVILARNISPGQRFERHAELYTIADLSHVWVFAEVFGKDAQVLRPGMKVRLTVPDSGEVLAARVSGALPEIDPVGRFVKIRLEVDNPRFVLRPEMFVTVELPATLSPGLTVPASALLDSGLSKHVFVRTGEDTFEPRTIETGWQIGDRVQIVKGLQEGDMIVSEGAFLVDSESRLQGAAISRASAAIAPSDATLSARR
jgi:Cu(I)/Ag(I) efflux system membrane fusion protein